ncbi:Uncharacterised protein [Shigella sonnei]|nr:Uncharacterised protein [Shigella sonnei]CSF28884.1 Uncharacterised protein [Shigella sonnei]CSF43309.1 Uncharacterised protein [Shigella sonnei]CSF94166.1 Uncharacterised protein [Shigella sonnei]CSG03335.1 Uncharacterised protein [Shigella sonnei]
MIGRNFVRRSAIFRLTQLAGKGSFFHPFKTVGLRFTAAFCQRLGEISEQYGDPQPAANCRAKQRIARHRTACHRDANTGGQQTADPDDKHHRIAPLRLRV